MPTAMVVPSNASALTAAGTREGGAAAPSTGPGGSSSPTRMTCFSDQSRTSKTWRRADASPSAATRMFLNTATCWNAPRGGSGRMLARSTNAGRASSASREPAGERAPGGGPNPRKPAAYPAAAKEGGKFVVPTTFVTVAPGW